MKRRLRTSLVAICILIQFGALAGAASAETSQTRRSLAGLRFVQETSLSPRLHEITVQTSALAWDGVDLPDSLPGLKNLPGDRLGVTKIRVLLPSGYDDSGNVRYPVLYLFHGMTGNYADWTTPNGKGRVEDLTKDLPIIVVMPDGGVAGAYSDWFNGGTFGPPKWKTYHVEQLVPWIDANFRTIPKRSARASAGLSMGGGGLRYAAQRPDLIGVTASFSGAIDIVQQGSAWSRVPSISSLIWGDRTTQEVRWRGVNGVDLAKNLGNTDVAIFSGNAGDVEGAIILPEAIAVHNALEEFHIDHGYTVYPGMGHTWPTFNKALAQWLPRMMRAFRLGTVPDAPTAFSYSSINGEYVVYDWTVRLQRRAIEFSSLEVTSANRFSVVASGQALVRTPALGAPNSLYRVRIHRSGRRPGSIHLRADEVGRLSISIALGRANPFQQYSPEANAAATKPSARTWPFVTLNDGSRFERAHVQIAPRNSDRRM